MQKYQIFTASSLSVENLVLHKKVTLSATKLLNNWIFTMCHLYHVFLICLYV